jgi:hypothetical protein
VGTLIHRTVLIDNWIHANVHVDTAVLIQGNVHINIEPLAYGNSARDGAKFKNKLMGVMVIFNLQKNKQSGKKYGAIKHSSGLCKIICDIPVFFLL